MSLFHKAPHPAPSPGQIPEMPMHWVRRMTILLILMLAVTGVYLVVGIFAAESPVYYTADLPFDHLIKLSAPWLVVYFFMYFQILAPAAAIRDQRVLVRMGTAFMLMYLVAVPIWIWLPVTVPRDPVRITDFWTFCINVLRWKDPPVNCLPSMHVAHSAVAALAVRRVDRLMGRVMLLSVGLIWWSTLAVGQHWFVDGLMGLTLAVAADWFVFDYYKPLPKTAFTRIDRKWHFAWIGFFIFGCFLVSATYHFEWVPHELLPVSTPKW